MLVEHLEELSLSRESKACLFGIQISAQKRHELWVYSSETGDIKKIGAEKVPERIVIKIFWWLCSFTVGLFLNFLVNLSKIIAVLTMSKANDCTMY